MKLLNLREPCNFSLHNWEPCSKIFSEANNEPHAVSATNFSSDNASSQWGGTIAETQMELPVTRQQPLSTQFSRDQQVPPPAPSVSSILTSLNSSFFPEGDFINNQNSEEPSSRYRVLPSSPPVLPQQNQSSTYASTIPDITISSTIADSPTESNRTLVAARDFTPRSFIHFHGATAGIGLAKRWRCKYCMNSLLVYSLTN